MDRFTEHGLSTKNVPDAIEWHFAKYWDHMLDKMELSYEELQFNLITSSNIIERCVAIPIMVKTTSDQVLEQAEKIRITISEIL